MFEANQFPTSGKTSKLSLIAVLLAAEMPVVIVHIAAVGVGDLELRSGDERAGHAVLLLDDQGTGALVPEGQLLRLSCLDENVLRGSV